MRVAVIGAGIVGVTTGFELAADGHEVDVFERRTSVATEASFANAGVMAPGQVAPWAAPGMPWKVLCQRLSRHAAVRFAGLSAFGLVPWMWRWWRACRAAEYRRHRAAMWTLAHYSHQCLGGLTRTLRLDFEQAQGCLILLRSPRDAAAAHAGLTLLSELGVPHEWLDGAQARVLEPGLHPQTALAAALHLPDGGVGNCRQFAHLIKTECQRLGVHFRFGHDVTGVTPGARPRLEWRHAGSVESVEFDAVVVCAGVQANRVLGACGVRLPLAAIHGYSITAPLRHADAAPVGPRAAVIDARFEVALTRLGHRVRVAGVAELGGSPQRISAAALATLYRVLDDWFPGSALLDEMQVWKGTRPTLPDGPPVLGASGARGVWLNLGHGSAGWALSCGSARIVADLLGGRTAAIDIAGFGVTRLGR